MASAPVRGPPRAVSRTASALIRAHPGRGATTVPGSMKPETSAAVVPAYCRSDDTCHKCRRLHSRGAISAWNRAA
jgi:hypothetical protein